MKLATCYFSEEYKKLLDFGRIQNNFIPGKLYSTAVGAGDWF